MTTLRLDDRNLAVLTLQKQLNALGAGLYPDGHYGEQTEQAVRDYQRRTGLVVDGIAGPKTMAALAGQDIGHLLKQRDLERAAERLGVPLASVLAINLVESKGNGFLDNGRPEILFERHVMRERLLEHGYILPSLGTPEATAAALAERYPGIVNATPGGYAGGAAEHQRLAQARQIHDSAGLESASWGLFQIMGYHWQRIGYASVQEFAHCMAENEAQQLGAFVRFIEADQALHKALKARKWAEFARRYNGAAYARNLYDVKLTRAYEQFAWLQEAA
ncbi:PG-binding-1 domain-containing protein [Azotobacter vinelandii CA]|uniref:PG-binding-1 domain-containing protein n=2 Tax=Azotobacter vinelandii TaxID=354 RepID=C1DS23_AZOVD|nr:N-acetylmuramidase family protein [Azotobacter vinelandii]ACO79898.1 PG-binding-1 domain-containing protein [Azotobacter vinelandii DJ]AGK16168.1 PG-binding-1 domain-containing protein [Azotobacter vinelandii CA]AGK21581.1 PG-binding-1 domain-containing protein [Azotobacter vinelandii CA6]SFX44729.1 Putative peptidoglycan binding domain-containing protein [Azotobacter vinelandii]GLK62292.1 peptidoglycan-binding protein [Azotobacter vinelandii]